MANAAASSAGVADSGMKSYEPVINIMATVQHRATVFRHRNRSAMTQKTGRNTAVKSSSREVESRGIVEKTMPTNSGEYPRCLDMVVENVVNGDMPVKTSTIPSILYVDVLSVFVSLLPHRYFVFFFNVIQRRY